VEPLPRHELAELVAQWAPGRHDVEDLVWRHSGGNVFLARETVRAVLDGDPRGVPQTVRELVRAGAAGLSTGAVEVVRAVAAGVGEVEHTLLAAVVDVDGPELAAAVREAADAGFVVVAGADGYTLRHGLMTEVVSADLLPAERVELHGRYATALHGGHRVPGSAARLAHHWQLAGRPDQALEATLDAAQEAERLRGYAEAHRHWLRAATLPVPDAVRERGRYLERAASAAALAGDHGSAVALLSERLGEPDAPPAPNRRCSAPGSGATSARRASWPRPRRPTGAPSPPCPPATTRPTPPSPPAPRSSPATRPRCSTGPTTPVPAPSPRTRWSRHAGWGSRGHWRRYWRRSGSVPRTPATAPPDSTR
jgi:hypothetical protein